MTEAAMTEIVELRTANSKTFDTGGGGRQLQGFREPVHYQDADGVWQDTDCSIEDGRVCKCDYDVTLLTNAIGYEGKDTIGEITRVELMMPYVEPVIDGVKATYPISEDADFEIIFTPQGIITHMLLKSDKAVRDFEYKLVRAEKSPWHFESAGFDSKGQKCQLKTEDTFVGRPSEIETTELKQHWTGSVAVLDETTRKKSWSTDAVEYPVRIG